MNVSDYDFDLPPSLIAQTPLSDRSSSRLLVLDKQTGGYVHRKFTDLVDYMQAGDVLVVNDSRVLPARLFGVKIDTGAKVEVLLLTPLKQNRWKTLVRPGKKLHPGAKIGFGNTPYLLEALIEEEGPNGERTLHFQYEGLFNSLLDQLGKMPLPPYIKSHLDDNERYQTVYSAQTGSAAAPTAGLHFTTAFLSCLQQKGVRLCPITLHVGLGTFRPVNVEILEDHHMHAEWYRISEQSAALLNEARAGKSKIIAVGTTSARVLETVGAKFGTDPIAACQGWTDIFIYPGYKFHLTDSLLTNFHLPRSTLMMLVSALAGKEHLLQAYKAAITESYRFFSFGDAMFIH